MTKTASKSTQIRVSRPRVGQRRVAPGYGVVTLVERQERRGEGPMYVIGRSAQVDGGYERLAAYTAATVSTWAVAS